MIKVMIVDDEVLVRVGLKSMFIWEDYGYTVVCDAQNGVEALKKIEQYEPHIVLTDLMMSIMDGFELITHCQTKYPKIKFVVLSNYNDFENVKRAMKLGASDYIFKLTIRANELIKVLEETSVSIKEEKVVHESTKKNAVVIKHLSAIKTELLSRILNLNYFFRDGLLDDLNSIPLKCNLLEPYVTVLIRVDNLFIIRKKNGFTEFELLKFSLENITDEVFNKTHSSDVYLGEDMNLIIVINRNKEEDLYQFKNIVANNFKILVQYIKQYCGLDISGALSDEYIGIEGWSRGVAHNKELIEKSFFFQSSELMINGVVNWKYPIQLPKNLQFEYLDFILTNCNYSQIFDYGTELIEYIGEQIHNKPSEVRDILRHVYQKVVLHLNSEKLQFAELRDSNGITIMEGIEGYYYYDDLKKSILGLICQYRIDYENLTNIKMRREITEIINYIYNHLQDEITVQIAAHYVNMSESHFSHLFKREIGTSFMDYVTKVRIEQATKYLQETDYKIADVADLVGVPNTNYFSVMYKKRTGKSPNKCRKIK